MSTHITELGEVCDLIRGVTFPSGEGQSELFENSIACLTTSGVQKEVAWKSRRFIRRSRVGNERQILRAGDILISTANSKELVGKSCAVGRPPFPCTFGAFVTVARPKTEVYPPFLAYWMVTRKFLAWCFRNSSNTTNISNLRVSELEALEFPLPDLPEQKLIAEILEKADQLRRTRRSARQLNDTFLQSVFFEMFGRDKMENYRAVQSLLDEGAIQEIEDGNHGEIHPRATDFVKEGIPFLTATNVIDDQVMLHRVPKISVTKAAQLRIGWIKSGDVLLSHNATVGRVAIVPNFRGKMVIGTSLTFYRLNRETFTPEYFAGALRSLAFQAQLERAMRQTTRNQVPVTRQKTLLLLVPPLSLQQKFAAIVRRFERLRAQQREAERQAEHLFQTLLHRAFSGGI